MTKTEAQIVQFEKALQNLSEVLQKMVAETANPVDHSVFRDSAIKRFEICFDICWKTAKQKLFDAYGIEVASPKTAFREAFKQGMLENDGVWITMTDMRNETAHSYDEEFAEKILAELPAIREAFEKLLWTLQK